jgi:hypothetical protein
MTKRERELIKTLKQIQKVYRLLSNENRVYHNCSLGPSIYIIAEDAINSTQKR